MILLQIIAVRAITLNNLCSCNQLKTEYECVKAFKLGVQNCFWFEAKCQRLEDFRQYITCPLLNYNQCEQNRICIINYPYYNALVTLNQTQNSTYCQKFTKCNDLSFGPSCQTVGCLGTNGSCYFDLQNRQDQACSQILDKNNCNQMYLNYKQILCYWSTSCQSLSYSSCSQIENSTLCGLVDPCKWNSTACLPKKCSDQSVNECQSIYALETSTYTYCRLQTTKVTNTTWNQTCVDSNPLTLNLQNCYIGSAYQFSWNLTSKACAPCITIPKFAYIISVMLILIL